MGKNTTPARTTPLHWATYSGNEEAIRELVRAGANVNVRDDSDHTPLIEASNRKLLEAVKILLKAGAEVNVMDNNGKTALGYAVYHENPAIANLLRQYGAK